MNNLFRILRIILPFFIAWGLISSCKEGVEGHIGAHEVKVFNFIEVSLKIEKAKTDKVQYVKGTSCDGQAEDISSDALFGGADYYYLDVSADHILCVPEGFGLKFRITGIYNNGEKRDLNDAEVAQWVRWDLAEQSDPKLKAEQHPDFPPKIVRVYDRERYESGDTTGDVTADVTADVKLNAVFNQNQLNANQRLTLAAEDLISIVLLEPSLDSIKIIVDDEATSDDFCDIIEDSPNSVVEGCLKQFKAIARLNNDLTGDLTEWVEWASDDPIAVAKFLRNVTSISSEVQGRDWADTDNPENTKVVKYIIDNGLFDKDNPSEAKKGLILAKGGGQFRISATFAKNQKYNRSENDLTGWYINETTPMNAIPPRVRDMKLRINSDSIGNPEFGNEYNPTSDPPKYISALQREATTDGSGYIYTMIENTNANLVAYGVYENKYEALITPYTKWTATERDGTQDVTSDKIIIGAVKGNIVADCPTNNIVTITAEKDSFKRTMKVKVAKELLLGMSFEPKRTNTSGDHHLYYTMKNTEIKNIKVRGVYSNSGLQSGRITAERLATREARLNYFAEWVEDFVAVDSTTDVTDDLLETKKVYASFQDYLNTSASLRKFPIYFMTREYDGTSDFKVRVEGVYDASSDATHDATYDWRITISKEGLPPVNVEITPDPYRNNSTELWLAEKPIQLEAVGIYQNGESIILGLDKVRWSWILPGKTGCGQWSEWSENKMECQCDIGYEKRDCVIGNGSLLSHQDIAVRAISTEHESQFDTITLTFNPSGQTFYETALQSVRLSPQNVALEAGNIAVLGAEGVFDNGRAYLLHNSCLEWRVTDNSALVQNADGSGIIHPDPGETFVVLRIDQDAGTDPTNDSITLQVDTKLDASTGVCDYVNWQKVDISTSDSSVLSIADLPAIKFGDFDRSVDVAENFSISIEVQRAGSTAKKITGFYSVENIDTSADDYDLTTDMFVIEAGQTSGYFEFTANDDLLDENNEKVRIKILKDSLVNARLENQNEATIDITINDTTLSPTLSLLNPSPTENETAGTVFIDFRVNPVSGRDITLTYNIDTSVNPSCDSNDHNLPSSGSVTIPKGFDKYFIQFGVSNDDLYEAAEKLKVNINSTNPSWSDSYTLTITDNDKLNIRGLDPTGDNACGNDYKACSSGGPKTYRFIPKTNAQYPNPDFEYTIIGRPSWAAQWNDACQSATYSCSFSGELSGTISVGDYKDILICVKNVVDGGVRGKDCLAPFSIKAQ